MTCRVVRSVLEFGGRRERGLRGACAAAFLGNVEIVLSGWCCCRSSRDGTGWEASMLTSDVRRVRGAGRVPSIVAFGVTRRFRPQVLPNSLAVLFVTLSAALKLMWCSSGVAQVPCSASDARCGDNIGSGPESSASQPATHVIHDQTPKKEHAIWIVYVSAPDTALVCGSGQMLGSSPLVLLNLH